MTIKYECEATENGYVERVIIDGKVEWEAKHKATANGSKRIEGEDAEDVLDQDLAEELPAFLGLKLMDYISD